MNKLDYWFLDVALEMPIGINSIVPDRQGFLDVNRKPLNISLMEMAEILDNLFKQEYLGASKPYGIPGGSSPGKIVNFIPSKEEVLQGLQMGMTPEIIEDGDEVIEIYDNLFNFFLTLEGGLLWESVSNPQWDKFFLRFTDFDEGETTIQCCNRDIIGEILTIEHLLDHGGLHIKPELGSEKYELINCWHPVYWKNIPSAYQLFYKFTYSELDENLEDLDNSPDFIARRKQARDWYKNVCNNWYINYFKTH